jgi:urease accessory protein
VNLDAFVFTAQKVAIATIELSIMDATRRMPFLWLLQLSDTALPIGGLNHSFGLETLAAEESLSADGLEAFLSAYLEEIGSFEIHFCGAAYRLGIAGRDRFPVEQWLDLNVQFSASKLARESRSASATLGRRFLRLVNGLVESPILATAIAAAQETETEIHHSAAFGLAGAALGIDEESTLLAYSHQSLANLISSSQRLLPLGQTQATRMLWKLKPLLAELVRRAQENDFDVNQATCFAPLVEVGSMRHPTLPTRLFIS